jgi:UDP-N-acetylglucosamine--N-acetylmuramyl-(pentapeptide) pyrophosphoryl-undecaprenol N-acetylglucosamine transferase
MTATSAGTSTFAVMTGGGTAGHVLPAVAVADELVGRGHARQSIHFVGAARGVEARLVPPTGYPMTVFELRSFPRRPTPKNLLAAARLTGALGRAVALLRRLRPRVVVSVGGYASVPCVAAAVALRVPIVVISYDALPGRASLLAARVAKASAVAFDSSPLPRKVVTGTPLRREILAVEPERDRGPARAALGLPPDRFTILVFGGSHGSGKLNDVIDAYVERHRDRTDLAVRHVIGARNDDGRRASITASDARAGIVWQVVPYEEHMELAYAAADVVVARAGASTIAELAAIGLPSILVPWKDAAEDHQTANARSLSDVGGAVLVPERDFDVDRLEIELDRLQREPAARAAMAHAARATGHRGAAAAVARLVEEHAR